MTTEELSAVLDRAAVWTNRLNGSPLLKKLVATGITILLEGGTNISDADVVRGMLGVMMRNGHLPELEQCVESCAAATKAGKVAASDKP